MKKKIIRKRNNNNNRGKERERKEKRFKEEVNLIEVLARLVNLYSFSNNFRERANALVPFAAPKSVAKFYRTSVYIGDKKITSASIHPQHIDIESSSNNCTSKLLLLSTFFFICPFHPLQVVQAKVTVMVMV